MTEDIEALGREMVERVGRNLEASAKRTEQREGDEPKREKPEPKLQGREVPFPEIEPWPDPVDGAALLEDMRRTFQRFVALPFGADVALVLWTIHAHAHDLCDVSPLLVLKSPAMRCGKTTLLRVLGRLVPRPLHASNITPSALFRAVEKYRPTLLVDEADSFVGENEELRGLLNSGHERENAVVIRTVGKDFEPRAFSTWSPKVVASIGSLAATLEDRSVTIPMRRRAPSEKVERLRLHRRGELEPLRRMAERWTLDHADELRDADPYLPESLDDRCADNWRSLMAVALVAGGPWLEWAREAATVLSGGRADEAGARVELLADIRAAWAGSEMPSAELVAALNGMESRPWSEWSRGRPLTQNALARMLRGFDVRPRDIRAGTAVLKGYIRADFEDAWNRYISPVAVANGDQPQRENPRQDCNVAVVAVADPPMREAGDLLPGEVEP